MGEGRVVEGLVSSFDLRGSPLAQGDEIAHDILGGLRVRVKG